MHVKPANKACSDLPAEVAVESALPLQQLKEVSSLSLQATANTHQVSVLHMTGLKHAIHLSAAKDSAKACSPAKQHCAVLTSAVSGAAADGSG